MGQLGRQQRPGWRLLGALLALQLAGCTTTETITATAIVKAVPEVAEVVVTDSLASGQLKTFRERHKEAGEVVMQGRVYKAYWVDDLQLDRVVLRPQEGGRVTEVVKVRETGGRRLIKMLDGHRNGKPFSAIEVLDE